MLRWPIPRLVCVLPTPEKPLEESDRAFEVWSAKLREWYLGGKRQGSGFATRKLRVFFLCAQDMSLAECGPKGLGYEVGYHPFWEFKLDYIRYHLSFLSNHIFFSRAREHSIPLARALPGLHLVFFSVSKKERRREELPGKQYSHLGWRVSIKLLFER